MREQAVRRRQRRLDVEQPLQNADFAAPVLDVAVVAGQQRQRLGIGRVVGDEVLHDVGGALDVRHRHIELVHVKHRVRLAVSLLVAVFEHPDRFPVVAVPHQHRPLFTLARNQRDAGAERNDRQGDDESDVLEHQRRPPELRQVTSIVTGLLTASASTVSARMPSAPTTATSFQDWLLVSDAVIW